MASEDCAQIDDNFERLNCYDAIYKPRTAESEPPEEVFARFDELTRFVGPELIVQSGFADCQLYFRQVEPKQSGSGGVVWQLLVDMSAVDPEKTGLGYGGFDIVMERGFDVTHSKYEAVKFGFGNEHVVNWDTPEVIPDPSQWERHVISQQLLSATFPPLPREHGGDIRFRVSQERSVEWGFWSAFPEDKTDISDAFLEVVKACEK